MIIISEKIRKDMLQNIEEITYFDKIKKTKTVVDIGREIIAVDADLPSDLETLLLENGSEQKNLYGINIYFDTGEIEFDSMINPPRNRDAGYPRAGRYVADPVVREKIEEVVNKWIEL